jgi:molybdopterin-containing oxidoreductase family iron-sulfur binding subunit
LADQSKRFWKSLRQRDRDPELLAAAQNEFPAELNAPAVHLARRDFLKFSALSAGLAVATGCSRAPVEKAIPLLVANEEIVPGRSLYYATTCGGCSAGCGALVKVRDGRPIKLEGNPQHPVSRGGLCAIGQASVLGLYDSQRIKGPRKNGSDAAWADVDNEIRNQLQTIARQKGAVRFLTGTITSPTLKGAIADFLKPFSDARHVIYDAISSSAILDAHEQTHGARLLPHYRFEKADVIAGFDADFLGTWISPVEFTAGYHSGRDLNANPPSRLAGSWHVQFEPRMTITGAKADRRYTTAPAEVANTVAQLAQRIASRTGAPFSTSGVETSVPAKLLDEVADRLWTARGHSLVVSGSQDVSVQTLVNFINHALGNYGSTIDLDAPSAQKQGSDRALAALVDELQSGKVSALFVYGANPVFDLPQGKSLTDAIKHTPLLVNFAQRADETAILAGYNCPDHDYLESWSDAEPVAGTVAVIQPTIRPLFNTRAVLESLAVWSGQPRPMYDIVRDNWRRSIFPRQKKESSFDAFWERAVQDGLAQVDPISVKPKPFNMAAVRKPQAAATNGYTLILYPTVAMADGRHSYNAFLQELPDPISKITWDNYANVSPRAAAKLGVTEGDTLQITATNGSGTQETMLVPVNLQPGQHDQAISVGLGYGSVLSRRFADAGPKWIDAQPSVGGDGLVGKNVAPFLRMEDMTLRYERSDVHVVRGNVRVFLAATQEHNTLLEPKPAVPGATGPREIVQETVLPVFAGEAGKPRPDPGTSEDIWPADHPYNGHRWAMAVDLSACTGCSSCVVACQVENNIPVVGKDEVRRNREMHWLRIDRYYAETGGAVDVAFQPLMCQQCDNAPCETVCPVLATVHSDEGLNQQVYNRCVGTRYCANNCPYKARRFNWFDYAHNDLVENLMLNPDVAVRTRGVMEKCTFCVQRIQEQKIVAKVRGEAIADGAIQTACQQSCPAQAIVFGDLNDPKSRIAQLVKSGRSYRVLDELGVKPEVAYLKIVRNREHSEGENNG